MTTMGNTALLSTPENEAAALFDLVNWRAGSDEALAELTEQHFHMAHYRHILKAIREVSSGGGSHDFSAGQVIDQLRRDVGIEAADMAWSQMVSDLGLADVGMTLRRRVDILHHYAKRRAVRQIGTKLALLGETLSGELDTEVEHIRQQLDDLLADHRRADDFTTLDAELGAVMQTVSDNLNTATRHQGIRCGLADIDARGGLPRNALVVIGGKSSHGKTSLADYMALNAMKDGERIAYFSLEMTTEELAQRFVAMESGVDASVIAHQPTSADERQRIAEAVERLHGLGACNVRFDRRGVSNFDKICRMIRSLKSRPEGLDLVVVDYMQLLDIDADRTTDTQALLIARAAHDLKDLCRQLGVTIIALSQINRNCQGLPSRYNLRDSGAIDEAADMTFIIYRAEADHLTAYPAPFADLNAAGTMLIMLEKYRNGQTLNMLMGFTAATTMLTVLPEGLQHAQPAGGEAERRSGRASALSALQGSLAF